MANVILLRISTDVHNETKLNVHLCRYKKQNWEKKSCMLTSFPRKFFEKYIASTDFPQLIDININTRTAVQQTTPAFLYHQKQSLGGVRELRCSYKLCKIFLFWSLLLSTPSGGCCCNVNTDKENEERQLKQTFEKLKLPKHLDVEVISLRVTLGFT